MKPADIVTDAEMIRSRDYDDIYYARGGALAEARHVFIQGVDFAAQCHHSHHNPVIVELGFGAGINALATAQYFLENTRRGILRYFAIDNQPMPPDMQQAVIRQVDQPATIPQELLQTLVANAPPAISNLYPIQLHPRIWLTIIIADVDTALRVLLEGLKLENRG